MNKFGCFSLNINSKSKKYLIWDMNFLGFMLRKGRKFNVFDQSVQQILAMHKYKNTCVLQKPVFNQSKCQLLPSFFGCINLIFQGENHIDKIQLFS
jgi:hypothetical protein